MRINLTKLAKHTAYSQINLKKKITIILVTQLLRMEVADKEALEVLGDLAAQISLTFLKIFLVILVEVEDEVREQEALIIEDQI